MTEAPGERLQKARKARGFQTANDVIERFGFNPHTYKAHENGARNITIKAAEKYASIFKVTKEYILFGNQDIAYGQTSTKGGLAENPARSKSVKIPVWGVIDSKTPEKYALNTEDTPIDWIDPLPSQQLDKEAFALILAGESMLPKYAAGEIACFNSRKPAVKGRACAIELVEGGCYFKIFIGADGDNMVFEQTNPQKKIRIKKNLISRIMPLVAILPG